jgi:RNA polymerase sigma factor (sigma-70 family)
MSQGTEAKLVDAAARRRAAVEMIARHEAALKRTARRYSLDAQDAEDAYQRALEIALTKAPTTESDELIRWTQTVTKHEALAVRQSREKLLGRYPRREGADHDPVEQAPARGDGPAERVERREDLARSREALQALKPAELQALSLLAEGYSYAEIGERTGFSKTKVNRVLAEGRARFRGLIARHEDGSRCRELRPLLSAFCDGEATPRQADAVREHLRACGGCRATMRAYRRAPRLAAALLPLAPPSRSLLGRLHDLVANLFSRLPGMGSESLATQGVAASGGRGAGMAALAKLATVCLGAAGGAAACVAVGVLPAPTLIGEQPAKPRAIEREAAGASESDPEPAITYEPSTERRPTENKPSAETKKPEKHSHGSPPEKAEAAAPKATAESAGAIEYEAPPPAPEAAPVSAESAAAPSSGSAAGEFGP